MDNFIYSLNATMPVFLVIVIGYLLKRIGMLNKEFVRVANKFNFTVTLPALLLRDIAGVDIRAMFDLRYVLFCAIATTISFFSIWFCAKKFLKDKTIVGAFVQASFRSSAAVLGIAFIQNMYGNSGMAPLMIIGSVPLYNIFAVIVLTFEASEELEDGTLVAVEGKERDLTKVKEAAINICKNPIILSIAAGLILSLLRVEFPTIVSKTVNSLASMASPLALIAIGAAFEGKKAIAKIKPSVVAASLKLVILAGIFVPVAIWLGFRNEKLIALLIMLASPTTPSCYIMARNMKNDGVLTASVVVLTTLLSAVTLTMWIYLLKSFGYL